MATPFTVTTGTLRATADRIERAVACAHAMREHPGVVRGRAQDGGDDDLRDAAAELAERWDWGLRVLVGDAKRLADALQQVAQVYEEVERQVASAQGRGEPP